MKSVVNHLQTEDFTRIRIGIGAPEHKSDMINYVIGPIKQEEKDLLQIGVDKGAEAVIDILKNGVDISMNKFNIKE